MRQLSIISHETSHNPNNLKSNEKCIDENEAKKNFENAHNNLETQLSLDITTTDKKDLDTSNNSSSSSSNSSSKINVITNNYNNPNNKIQINFITFNNDNNKNTTTNTTNTTTTTTNSKLNDKKMI
jgi:bifunctional autolysin